MICGFAGFVYLFLCDCLLLCVSKLNKIVCAWLWEEFSVKDTYMEAETFSQHEIT